jgi:superfamily II DNA or RNA helicase
LKNRLNDEKLDISDIGLVIVDEAHYNSFTKIFKFFDKSFILGVTATPLSSNIKLPMYENYQELFVGETIQHLIDQEYLSRANLYSYNVGLTSLEVGANGDYTVKSSEDLYTNTDMLSKLVSAYEETAKGKKTLIFNNGINTSIQVYHAFKKAGYPIAHLDNTNSRKERDFILKWFKKTPNAIITSVSILTTGFDEPTIEAIILNRATKSLTLYYQMIGRGSRILNDKNTFDVVDLGNNFHRFGAWGADLDWQKMFRAPDYYLDAILSDEEIESTFRYELPADVKKDFANSKDTYFDMKKVYIDTIRSGESSKRVLEKSIEHHAKMCIENSEDVFDALILAKKLGEETDDRINRYAKCISKSTHNFVTWLKDDYRKKLNAYLRSNFDEVFEEIFGHPPIEE